MSQKVFNTLLNRHQILEHIPPRLPRKFKKCYLRKTIAVGMYDAMFTTGLRLLLMKLHHQLSNYLGLSISQLAPNAKILFIGTKMIWGRLSGRNYQLTLDEFFYCYKPQQISLSKGIYHFLDRKASLKLVFDIPDSNRNWKNIYFFVKGTDWVCRLVKWDSMPDGFNNTCSIVKESSESLVFISYYLVYFSHVSNFCFFSF